MGGAKSGILIGLNTAINYWQTNCGGAYFCARMKHRLILPLVLLLGACSQPKAGNDNNDGSWTPPPAGTVVAADSMKVKDPLNDFYFAVKLVSSPANGEEGNMGFVYDVEAHYGPNAANSRITMPKGGNNLRPLLRPDKTKEYTYILGFIPGKDYGGSNEFQDYYAISASRGTIEIRALKSYSFN